MLILHAMSKIPLVQGNFAVGDIETREVLTSLKTGFWSVQSTRQSRYCSAWRVIAGPYMATISDHIEIEQDKTDSFEPLFMNVHLQIEKDADCQLRAFALCKIVTHLITVGSLRNWFLSLASI